MISHYNYPLSIGTKQYIRKNQDMAFVIQSLLQVPGGKITVRDICSNSNLSYTRCKGYLQKLKLKGIVSNSNIGTSERKEWFLIPGIRESLTIFIQSVGME